MFGVHVCGVVAGVQELCVSADNFEQLAMRVCKAAFEDDKYQGMAALEQPLPLLPGYKLIELAYYAECFDFISACCSREIDRRFAGDLLPTDHTLALPGGLRVVLGVHASVLTALVLGCGLLAPLLLHYQASLRALDSRGTLDRLLLHCYSIPDVPAAALAGAAEASPLPILHAASPCSYRLSLPAASE